MIEIKQEIQVYEIDGEDVGGVDGKTIGINGHWNNPRLVVIVVDGKEYTVSGRDMQVAMDNAMRTN